jgi:preprotein translocase subunit SecB
MAEQAQPSLPLFPIQLRKVDVGQVAYNCHGFSDPTITPATKFGLTVAVSPFAEADRSLQVSLTFQCSSEPPNSVYPHPYSLAMTLHGEFGVELERLKFDADGIRKWGEKNGALVLLPFLREAVYSFTQKTGFRPLLIPLIETAAFSVMPPPPRPGADMATLSTTQARAPAPAERKA